MSEADGQQEPSMEEILASIRRIISEDGDSEEGAAPKAEPAPAADPALADPEPEDQILEEVELEEELTEMPEPDDEVLELTEMVEDDGTVVDLNAPAGGIPDLDFGLDDEAPSPLLPPDAGTPIDDGADEGEALLSDHVAAAAAGSLAALSTAAGRKIADQLGASDIGGVTVEELVRQLLRPMLRDWLDEHLPGMVERLVRREIERLAAQGTGR